MRIALLSYRSKPHCGGQGVYVRHLSRELTALGHTVEVFSGQPYPELDAGRGADQGAQPRPLPRARTRSARRGPSEIRDLLDVEEVLTMWTAGFPEPKTFSKRAARLLRERLDDFDIVHDNQVLGYGMLDIKEMGLPLITSIHHPITFDRRIDLAAATTAWQEADAAPLVRLPADAGQGGPRGRARSSPSRSPAAATSSRTSASTTPTSR